MGLWERTRVRRCPHGRRPSVIPDGVHACTVPSIVGAVRAGRRRCRSTSAMLTLRSSAATPRGSSFVLGGAWRRAWRRGRGESHHGTGCLLRRPSCARVNCLRRRRPSRARRVEVDDPRGGSQRMGKAGALE